MKYILRSFVLLLFWFDSFAAMFCIRINYKIPQIPVGFMYFFNRPTFSILGKYVFLFLILIAVVLVNGRLLFTTGDI